MRDRFIRVALIALVVVFGVFAAQPYIERALYSATAPRAIEPRGELADIEQSTVAMFQQVSPSVVQVAGHVGGNALQMNEEGVQTGTGFIWDGAGHVVTNNHVVQGTSALSVRLATGEVVQAKVVGTTPNYDLAVIILEGARQLPPPLAIGSSADLKVGQFAFAIGNPFGLDQSLTMGVISALKRRLPTSTGHEISNVIQTDAAINPGNSGGPLLDSAGRLIGVNTAIVAPGGGNAGVGFAIPSDIVNRVVPQLIRTGHMPSPGIGVVLANEAVATRLGVDGVIIARVLPGSPAERAGLQGVNFAAGSLGDTIVKAGDKTVRRVPDLTDELEQVGVGGKVHLGVERDGRERSVDVSVVDVAEMPTTQ
jgi:2-alkenal reductase